MSIALLVESIKCIFRVLSTLLVQNVLFEQSKLLVENSIFLFYWWPQCQQGYLMLSSTTLWCSTGLTLRKILYRIAGADICPIMYSPLVFSKMCRKLHITFKVISLFPADLEIVVVPRCLEPIRILALQYLWKWTSLGPNLFFF